MAFEGDANQIGKVSVGIEANVDALRQGLEQAKQEATQKAAEIQQALKINPLGYDTTPERTGPTGGAAAAYGYGTVPPTVAAEAKKQVEEQAQATQKLGDEIRTTAGQVALLTANFQQFFQTGISIGSVLSDVTKQTLEYEQAVNEANVALEKSLLLRQQFTDQRVGGNAVAGNAAEERVQTLERANQEIRVAMDKWYNQLGDWTERFARGLYSVATGGEGPTWSTRREQMQQQISENEQLINFNRVESQRFRNAQEQRFTLGGIAGEVAGLAPGSLPPMEKLSPAQAAFMRKLLADNPDYLEQLIYWNKLGYNAQQQQLIEMMNGNRQVDYR